MRASAPTNRFGKRLFRKKGGEKGGTHADGLRVASRKIRATCGNKIMENALFLKPTKIRPAAEFERFLIQERTSARLKAAGARGRVGGRPKTMDQKKLSIAESLYKDGKTNVSEICKILGISRATFYRNISAKAA
jgi:hypothetical protein